MSRRRAWLSPPIATLLVGIALVASAALRIDVPQPGVFLLVAIAWTTTIGGLSDGLLSTAFAVAALVGYSTISHGSPFTPERAADNVVLTLSFISMPYIVGYLRQRLDVPLAAHSAVAGDSVTAEAQLARAREALMLQTRMLDAVRQAVIGVESDGIIFYWNKAAEELLGWPADRVVGKTTVAVMHLELDAEISAEFMRRLTAGKEWSDETTLRRRNGTTFPAQVIDSPIRNESDEVVGMVRIVSDVTQRINHQIEQRFLTAAGSDLASTLDLEALMSAIALLAVPALGECCIVDLVEEDGASRRVEITWSGALARTDANRASRRTSEKDARAASLLSTGGTALITPVSDAVLRNLTANADDLDRLRRGGVRSAIVAPMKAGGRLLGTLTVLSTKKLYNDADVTLVTEFARRVALAADNAILYETARLASAAKSDFLAVMSHELRTPLTTVMGYTDLLLAEVSGALPAQSHLYVERIRAAAWHLLGLIEQILIYTRVDVGREQVHVEAIPVDYLLRDAAALIEPVAAEKGLEFILVPPTEAAYVDTDLTKIRQILLNLLSNAVKFTERGTITLQTQIGSDVIEFAVIDTGIGIAEEHHERIFDSFWQVDQSATRLVGGTGLGLSVARKLARMLGGEVTISSEPGAGTTFVLRLPRGGKPGRIQAGSA